MADEQKKQQAKKIIAELNSIHRGYLEKFSQLKKEQLQLLKEVTARVEALKIGSLVKEINKKHKK